MTDPIPKPASWQALVDSMTPAMHEQLKTAVELGRWPDGRRLDPEQVELCLQAVIAWDQQHLQETDRVAYIDRRKLKTSHCGDEA